jgi:hypothetical protein
MAKRRRDNPTLQWTGPALGVLLDWEQVGAVPTIERRSVIQRDATRNRRRHA